MTPYTTQNINERMRAGEQFTPRELVEMYKFLVSEFIYLSSRRIEIIKRQPSSWVAIRNKEGVASDTKAEHLYRMTEDGINEKVLGMEIKSVSKLLSAIKMIQELQNNEAKNLY